MGSLGHAPRTWKEVSEVTVSGSKVSFFAESQKMQDRLVQTEYPRAHIRVAYFEVKVLSMHEKGIIGVGFASSPYEETRFPGWDSDSIGFHSSKRDC